MHGEGKGGGNTCNLDFPAQKAPHASETHIDRERERPGSGGRTFLTAAADRPAGNRRFRKRALPPSSPRRGTDGRTRTPFSHITGSGGSGGKVGIYAIRSKLWTRRCEHGVGRRSPVRWEGAMFGQCASTPCFWRVCVGKRPDSVCFNAAASPCGQYAGVRYGAHLLVGASADLLGFSRFPERSRAVLFPRGSTIGFGAEKKATSGHGG